MESRQGNNQSQEQREATKNPEDLTAFVKNLLEQMQSISKFRGYQFLRYAIQCLLTASLVNNM